MTWGEIRSEVSAQVPGIGNDLLTSWMQRSYREILDQRDWIGLHADGILQTIAAYTDGTIAFVNGSASVTGTGTAWASGMTGRKLINVSRREFYTFTWLTATTGTLDRPYEGDTDAAAYYSIYQDRYPLPAQVKVVESMHDLNPASLIELRSNTPYAGTPARWANANDSDEALPPVLHSVELWPYPDAAAGIPYTYLTAVFEFDGMNTADSPLPWVSADAIISGTLFRAKVQDRSEFDRFLSLMERVENQKMPAMQMQIADRFASHRARRWMR